jgi:rhomboid family GlyGly-CTERM serine protease
MIGETWAFSREAIAAGDLWRLASANAAHLSWPHLASNLVVFAAAVVLLREVVRPTELLGTLALCAIGSTTGIYLGTSLDWYVGASGALHGLLAWGACRLAMPRGLWLLLLLMVNVALDQDRSTSWLSEPLAPQSHYWGLACGLALAIASAWRMAAAEPAWAVSAARRAAPPPASPPAMAPRISAT